MKKAERSEARARASLKAFERYVTIMQREPLLLAAKDTAINLPDYIVNSIQRQPANQQ